MLASDIINHLTKAKIFTKFDVRWGYNNIWIKEADQWKAAFITNCGLFESRIIYFGLTNSPTTFQMLMNMIFADLITGEKVAVYTDNILIYSADKATYQEITHKVLQRLKEYDMYLKLEKCKFNCNCIKYLGMIIEPGHVSMDHGKTAAVANWPKPCNLWDIRGFLGFVNFYHQFIKNFSAKVCLLNDLTKKDTP